MEVIGAVSSVVALVETTSKLSKGLVHLAQRWHNAPEEISALALATKELCTKFAYVQEIVTESPTTLVDDVTRSGLTQLVERAQAVTTELSTLRTKLEAKDIILQRARWAVKDAKASKAALEKVEDIEEGLSMWISFISLKGHSLSLQHSRETQQLLVSGFAEMKHMFSTMVITSQPLGLSSISSPAAPSLLAPNSSPTSVSTARNHSTTATRRVAGGLVWQASTTWKSWGLTGTVIKSTKGQSIDYDVTISLQLPLAWWFGSHLLKGQLSVSSLRQNTLTLRHPSYFAVARVLDSSHPFLRACSSRKIAVVREMLRNGEGRPTDENEDGISPLWMAVYHNSVELLVELLDNGANIDTKTAGTKDNLLEIAARYRSLDVLRMLLQRGASTDSCDEHGFDVNYYCWSSEDFSKSGASAIDTANVLSEYAVLDPQRTWLQGATILHVAAVSVDGHDVDALIARGHDAEAKDDKGATPILYAFGGGNASAYFALLAHGADSLCSFSSVEKMLHEAVKLQAKMSHSTVSSNPEKTGYRSIVKYILQHESPNINLAFKAPLGDEDYPPSVRGHRTTPRQLAEAYGSKTEAWFLTLLRKSGQSHYFTEQDKQRLRTLRLEGYAPRRRTRTRRQSRSNVEGEEQFWDAEENL